MLNDSEKYVMRFGLKCPDLGPGYHNFVLATDYDLVLTELKRLRTYAFTDEELEAILARKSDETRRQDQISH